MNNNLETDKTPPDKTTPDQATSDHIESGDNTTLVQVQPQAVLFDWDNTLVDTWGLIHAAMEYVFSQRNQTPWTLEEVMARCHYSCREAFPTLFPDDWELAVKDFYDFVEKEHLKFLEPLTNSIDVLTMLNNAKVPMALVSNKRPDILKKEVAHLNWGHFFKATLGSGDTAFDKPHPEPLLEAMRIMDVAPSMAVWYVGDALTDWQAAVSAGVQPIRITQHVAADLLMAHEAEYGTMAFSNMVPLSEFLKRFF